MTKIHIDANGRSTAEVLRLSHDLAAAEIERMVARDRAEMLWLGVPIERIDAGEAWLRECFAEQLLAMEADVAEWLEAPSHRLH